MKKHQTDVIGYSAIVAFSLTLYFWLIPNFVKLKKNADIGPDMFPKLLAGFLFVLGAIGLVSTLVAMKRDGVSFKGYRMEWKKYVPQVILLASGIVFILAAQFLGFLIAAVIYAFLLFLLFGSRRWVLNGIMAVVYPVILYLLFSLVLRIQFPAGIFGF